MVEHAATPMSPLATLFFAAVIVSGLLLGMVRGSRGSGMSDPDGWSEGDDERAIKALHARLVREIANLSQSRFQKV